MGMGDFSFYSKKVLGAGGGLRSTRGAGGNRADLPSSPMRPPRWRRCLPPSSSSLICFITQRHRASVQSGTSTFSRAHAPRDSSVSIPCWLLCGLRETPDSGGGAGAARRLSLSASGRTQHAPTRNKPLDGAMHPPPSPRASLGYARRSHTATLTVPSRGSSWARRRRCSAQTTCAGRAALRIARR